MRFLLDAHLPLALARWLNAHGCEAVHVRDIGLRDASDSIIWDEALRSGSVILTKDIDFVLRKAARNGSGPVVVLLKVGNCSTSELLDFWSAAWRRLRTGLMNGEHVLFLDRTPP